MTRASRYLIHSTGSDVEGPGLVENSELMALLRAFKGSMQLHPAFGVEADSLQKWTSNPPGQGVMNSHKVGPQL